MSPVFALDDLSVAITAIGAPSSTLGPSYSTTPFIFGADLIFTFAPSNFGMTDPCFVAVVEHIAQPLTRAQVIS
tara:strand:- start:95 stop:316 length:222 start_codon:yes stop_codon:yes gene_type:complete